MAKMLLGVGLPIRSYLWLEFLAKLENRKTSDYAQQVLLRHLLQHPVVDLSRSPFSEPKGVSDGTKEK